MKNLSNVDIHEFLSRCKRERVEGRTINYEGKEYAIPYSTVKIQDVVLPGLRENQERISLLEKIIEDNSKSRNSYLDVGSNLGIFVRSYDHLFKSTTGVDADQYYFDMCQFLYEDTNCKFVLADLNYHRLPKIFNSSYDVITALSMIEYIHDKQQFVEDLYNMTNEVCIIEGHSEDVKKKLDIEYENLLKTQGWKVERLSDTTDAGINAPADTWSTGRPIWVCKK
jgi:hypothetical protein